MNGIFGLSITGKKSDMKSAFVIALMGCSVIGVAGCTARDQSRYGSAKTLPPVHHTEHIPQDDASVPDCDVQEAVDVNVCVPQLTLEQCLDIAIKNNPDIAQRQWDTEIARAEKDIAAGALWPSIHLEGGYEHDREDKLIQPRRPGAYETMLFTDDLVSGNVVLTMPIYTGGRIQNQIKAADLLTKSARQQLVYSRSELVFNVTSIYYSMLGQQEVINSLIFSQQALQEHYKRTDELMKAQKAAQVDLMRTEVRLADIEQKLIRERNLLDIQGIVLAGLMGCDTASREVDIQGQLAVGTMPDELSNGLAAALSRRQDYLSLKSKLEYQRRMLDVAQSRKLPEVSLRATYGNRWDSDDFDKDNELGSVGIFAQIPLFEGGSIEAGIRRERSRLRAQQEGLRKLELRIQVEVETAVSNIESTHARIGVTEKGMKMAKESLRIECEKYDLGKGAIVDVLDAQSALLDSQMNYYRALADYNTAIAQFHLAVGEV